MNADGFHRRAGAWLAAAICVVSPLAAAGPLFHQGLLLTDDEIVQIGFDLVSDDLFDVRTSSWGGGTSANGAVVAGGGFAPVLALFAADGLLLGIDHGADHQCGAAGSGAPDAVTHICWDAGFDSVPLVAGHYTLVLSQDGNDPLGPTLADGYSQAGVPDYTTPYLPGSSGFVDVMSQQRSGHWALELSSPSLAVPEPDSGLLAAAGLGWLLWRRRAAVSACPAGQSPAAMPAARS